MKSQSHLTSTLKVKVNIRKNEINDLKKIDRKEREMNPFENFRVK